MEHQVTYLAALILSAAFNASAADPGDPRVAAFGAAGPKLLAVRIEVGAFTAGGLQPYTLQPGERIVKDSPTARDRWLFRGSLRVGAISGVEPNLLLKPLDTAVRPFLDLEALQSAALWKLQPAAGPELTPLAVHRKSKPIEVRRVAGGWSFNSIDRHTLYLELPEELREGESYRLIPPAGILPPLEWTHDSRGLVSEALHVNHLGFRPDDPSKLGFLSLWKGSGGPHTYAEDTPFAIIDESTRETVLEGVARPSKDARPGEDAYGLDHTLTPVLALDFSALRTEGAYRLYVPGVGVSLPFELSSETTWRKAFTFAARGLYHQRSGMELGPPFTNYLRPRAHHPDDGFLVFQSTAPFITADPADSDQSTIFKRLTAGATSDLLSGMWGGYQDAGDWDRHIGHLKVSRYLLRAWEFNPAYFQSLEWNIPKAPQPLPDLLEEALWCVEFFQRLQTPDGGIRGGLESEEHPISGEVSWNDSLKLMAFAPDVVSSWLYAASAAQAARLITPFDEPRGSGLRESAGRAMEWAEQQFAASSEPAPRHLFRDARNLAAIEMYRLTAEPRFHELFLATTAFTSAGRTLDEWQRHNQPEAAVAYLLESTLERDTAIVDFTRAALERSARDRVQQSRRTALRWTKHEYAPTGWGILGAPQAEYLVYGHKFTADPVFLEALVDASNFSLGANPENMTYTLGLGHAWPSRPLIVDAETTNQDYPQGIVIYGPAHPNYSQPWSLDIWKNRLWPADYKAWPTVENWVNLGLLDAMSNEYTVADTIAPAALVWGYLASR